MAVSSKSETQSYSMTQQSHPVPPRRKENIRPHKNVDTNVHSIIIHGRPRGRNPQCHPDGWINTLRSNKPWSRALEAARVPRGEAPCGEAPCGEARIRAAHREPADTRQHQLHSIGLSERKLQRGLAWGREQLCSCRTGGGVGVTDNWYEVSFLG